MSWPLRWPARSAIPTFADGWPRADGVSRRDTPGRGSPRGRNRPLRRSCGPLSAAPDATAAAAAAARCLAGGLRVATARIARCPTTTPPIATWPPPRPTIRSRARSSIGVVATTAPTATHMTAVAARGRRICDEDLAGRDPERVSQHPRVQVDVEDTGGHDAPDRARQAEPGGAGDEHRYVDERVDGTDPEQRARVAKRQHAWQRHRQRRAQAKIRDEDDQQRDDRRPLRTEEQRDEVARDEREPERRRQAQAGEHVDRFTDRAAQPRRVVDPLAEGRQQEPLQRD